MQNTSTKPVLEPVLDDKSSALKPKAALLKRILMGLGFLSLGVAAIAIGSLSVWARASQLTIDNGIVNARILRIRAPIAGQFDAVYANPGVQVKAGQVLARIKPSAQQEQTLLSLQGERQTTLAQLLAAQQSLAQSQQQLAELSKSGNAVFAADSALAEKGVQAKRSAVEEARSRVEQTHSIYERYRSLAAEGALTQALTDEKKGDWQAAEAALKGAEATLQESQTLLKATQTGAKYSPSGMNVSDQQARLVQEIQTQSSLVATLRSQLKGIDQRLSQARSLLSDKHDLVVKAPSSGVVYSIAGDQSEQVNQLESVLTLLDCKNLWVEGAISAQQASQIDTRQPVQVNLAGEAKALEGEVEMIQAMGNTPVTPADNPQGVEHINITQLQALMPPIKADLAGQPLMRVIIRIQPLPTMTQSQQFCGVGRIAQVTFSKKALGL
jgi:membrane fusion protein (multidrug efflux system)